MLLEHHLSQGNLYDEEEDPNDSDRDDDGLGNNIFRKYITAAGGPLFKAETEMMRRHNETLRLSAENRKLSEQRRRLAMQSDLKIGPIEVDRPDFEKHNNFGNIPSHPYRCLFTGATGSGKTTNMINLLIKPQFLKDYFDTIYIFSPNCKTEVEFEEIQKHNRGEVIMNNKFKQVEVQAIFDKLVRNAMKHRHDRSMMPRVLIFIDDFAGHKEVMNSRLLVDIFFMTRKYSASTWISLQRYKKAPADLRENSEFHVIYQQSATQTEIIADELTLGRFTKKHMIEAMNLVSDTDYSFLFINTRKTVPEGRFRFTYSDMLVPNIDVAGYETVDTIRDNSGATIDDVLQTSDSLDDGSKTAIQDVSQNSKPRKRRR